jgi:hypothetical protein
MFGPKRDEVTGERRKFHNVELHDLYSPQYCAGDKIDNEMGGSCSADGEERGVYRGLVRKPERKRPLGRPSGRWEDNIKMDFQKVGCRGMNWIELAQDRDRWQSIVNKVINPRVP